MFMPEPLPMIISVDDHVVEPPNVWQDRLPSKYADIGPRIVRAPMPEVEYRGGSLKVLSLIHISNEIQRNVVAERLLGLPRG